MKIKQFFTQELVVMNQEHVQPSTPHQKPEYNDTEPAPKSENIQPEHPSLEHQNNPPPSVSAQTQDNRRTMETAVTAKTSSPEEDNGGLQAYMHTRGEYAHQAHHTNKPITHIKEHHFDAKKPEQNDDTQDLKYPSHDFFQDQSIYNEIQSEVYKKYYGHEYRTIDGSGNNLSNPEYGQAQTQFIRMVESDYADGLNIPAGDTRPSARVVSNLVSEQNTEFPNTMMASDMFWLWGQFIDHDIDLTGEGVDEAFPIIVPEGDPDFDPAFTGTMSIMFTRSGFDETTGIDTPREQENHITAFIDASMIYGSDEERAAFLRDEGGKLKLSTGDLLPLNTAGLANAGGPSDTLFIAGDVRANENVALTSLHTLFVREHNRLVDEFQAKYPAYNDEQLYQEAKRLVEAEIQSITYKEYLPLLLGVDAIPDYTQYDNTINAQIANLFTTAAYRLGHTLLSDEIERLNEDGSVADSHLSLQNAFFRPDILMAEPEQIDNIFRGMSQGLAETVDTFIVEDVRSFLFGPPGAGGLDLVSLNIQRGRDHGLPDYNTVREAYGLLKVTDFSDITSDVTLQANLTTLYDSVDDIDLFIGGLAEDPLDGSMLGALFQAIILDQFIRLRDGDRFWYEERLSQSDVNDIDALKLSDIIERNTDIDVIQDNPFLSYQRLGGDDANNNLIGSNGMDLLIGFAGEDSLFGLDGNDELFGLEDDDILTGGAGNDRFVHRPGDGMDTVTDFNPHADLDTEQDSIDLTAHDAKIEDIQLTQMGADTIVSVHGIQAMTLSNILVEQLSSQDFMV